ncbi:MAG: ABC transporter permease [Gemmatimonadota bacterium]
MQMFFQDFRYSLRMLRKNPGSAIIAVVAFALGIGLTTTMFSIVYGALFRGLPYEESENLIHLERNNLADDIQSMGVPGHDFLYWRGEQESFEDIIAFDRGTANIADSGRPERYRGAFITAGSFEAVRVLPELGRTFTEEDTEVGAPDVVIVGHDMWTNRYDRDPDIVGRTIRVNGDVSTVIGVMPAGFVFPTGEDLWIPLRIDLSETERGDGTFYEVFGRLREGVSLDAAKAELATIAGRLALEYPQANEGVSTVLKPYTEEFIGQEAFALLMTMLVAVSGVLLIACANVANLLLARASSRSREVAIRSALGANRKRLIVQLLTDSFALSALGGLLGLGLAFIGANAFNLAIADTNPPFWIDIKVDLIIVGFVAALVLLASLLSGVFPAIKASRNDMNEILKDEAHGSSGLHLGRLSRVLVVVELSLACGLLVMSGLMIKSITKLNNTDFPFAAEEIFTARVGLFPSEFPEESDQLAFYEELERRLAGQAGVRKVSLSSNLPALGGSWWRVTVEGTDYANQSDIMNAIGYVVTPNFFDVFEMRPVTGRLLSSQDVGDSDQVVVVNESFARTFFSGTDAMGRRIRPGGLETDEPWRTIVGIIPDAYANDLEDNAETPEGLYIPLAQNPRQFMTISALTAGVPLALTAMVREQVAALNPNQPIYNVNVLASAIDEDNWFYGVFGTLFMIFGLAALLLAGIGLYGVMAFSVTQRTQELGVRMALGAQARDVRALVVRQGLWQIGIGLALGLGLATGLSRFLDILLYETQPLDPIIFTGVALFLAATGLVACYIPAHRATQVDPLVALRYE